MDFIIKTAVSHTHPGCDGEEGEGDDGVGTVFGDAVDVVGL